MDAETNTKFEELCNDEEYVNHVLSLGSAEAMSKELETKGIELSPEEIRKIGSLLRKKADGELSDEELEQIAGGSFLSAIICAALVGGCIYGAVRAAVKSC